MVMQLKRALSASVRITGAAMTRYSLLFIDADEHIGRSHQVDCLSDDQAIKLASQEIGDHRAVQVWAGERPVALVGNSREADKLQ